MKDERVDCLKLQSTANNVDMILNNKQKEKTNLPQRLCVVVTQKRSGSWVEDLHACEKKTHLEQVYN
jgi:hypothetical protein